MKPCVCVLVYVRRSDDRVLVLGTEGLSVSTYPAFDTVDSGLYAESGDHDRDVVRSLVLMARSLPDNAPFEKKW